ncbi:MAG: glycosyltransferase [Bacteroidetes bacterium]|nr:glycosyltransferase [Bacteroidota bacterium]
MAINVLYISYDGMTDPLGQSQVIPYLIGLTKSGYSFTLLSCEKEENFQQHQQKIQQILSENNIHWQPISYTKKPPVFSTIYDVFRIIKHAKKLHREKQFSIVHCRSYIAALVGMKMKKQLGVKFIFDMRGLWADERVDGKLWNLKNPLFLLVYNYFKKKEKAFLEHADYTISLTQNAKDELHSWKHIQHQPIKIEVIPCCVDLALFNPENVNSEIQHKIQNELQLKNEDFILMYLGSIGTWYILEEMMSFFYALKQKKTNAKFLFITKDEHQRIVETAEKYGVSDSIIIRPGNREEIPSLISIVNFSLFFILPSYSKKASSPTKQGEIMAMGIPIICNVGVGDTDKIVQKYQSGILVSSFDEKGYSVAIQSMSTSFSKQSIIDGANDYFSLEKGIEKYAKVYGSVF